MIKTKLVGVKEVVEFIKTVPIRTKALSMRAIATYIIGDMRHGLKHYQKYKYVSRKAAYGRSFFSDKQRRYVMAKIRSGEIDPGYPHRTGRLQRGWVYEQKNYQWDRTEILNRVGYSGYVMGMDQARQPRKAGWRNIMEVVESNMKGALKKAQEAIDNWIKQKGAG